MTFVKTMSELYTAAKKKKKTFEALVARKGPSQMSELWALFDALPAVDTDLMLGDWTGGVFQTGHPGEAQLDQLAWVGKRFESADAVDPIISDDGQGGRKVNEVMGSASLRQVLYRGVVTATMCYDKHPIFDHFRLLDENTVLGVMDRKGEDMPLFFYLRRCL